MARTPRTVVITGANSGIGLETAAALAAQGERVIIGCRNAAKADAAVEEIRRRVPEALIDQVPLDLASFESIRTAAASIVEATEVVDVLINNAGLILSRRAETSEGFETQFGVNHLGHFLLTMLLEDRLKAAAEPRIVNVASLAHWSAVGGLKFDNLQSIRHYNGWVAYGRSKLANVLFAKELAERWGADGVVAHALHPGVVRTEFGQDGDTGGASALMVKAGEVITITPAEGARTSIYLASAERARETNGGYWAASKPARCAPWARDAAAAARLWDVSEQLIEAGHP